MKYSGQLMYNKLDSKCGCKLIHVINICNSMVLSAIWD